VTAAVATARSLAGDRLQRRPAAIVALALVEARRLVFHPAYLGVLGYVIVGGGIGALHGFSNINLKGTAEFIGLVFIFYLPLIAIFAASLVASSARRAGADEMLAALPVTLRGRSAALVLAGLGPAAVSGLAAVVLWYLHRDIAKPPIPVHGAALIGVPLLYLGITCLGLAAARWLPWPGVPVAIVIGLFAWVAKTHVSSDPVAVLTAPWVVAPEDDKALVIVGYSDLWHLVYLTGLVGLAATAALFRDDLRRMVAVGVAIGVPTAFAAWAQLP
jgi:hypothetical protein